MSDYTHVPGGSLKFKGGDSTKKKKKKSSSHTTSTYEKKDAEASIAELSKAQHRSKTVARDDSGDEGEKKRRKKDSEDGDEDREEVKPKISGGRQMTDAERKFEEIQRRRRTERVAKTANMSHKDRVTEFNSKLDKLTEHNDIPKISWTG